MVVISGVDHAWAGGPSGATLAVLAFGVASPSA
jgi:hypothetical protein